LEQLSIQPVARLVGLMVFTRKIDRRQADRLPVPVCPTCRADVTMATVARTDAVLHFRCDACGHVRIVPKPAGNHSNRSEYIVPTVSRRESPASQPPRLRNERFVPG
jgi:Zn ribbon nucleic-acid-binding protein